MGDSSSGGGIVRGGSGSITGDPDMRAFRRRWTSGVVVISVNDEGKFRGVTVSGFLPLSVEPPSAAIALQSDSSFQSVLGTGTIVGVSVLDRRHEFFAERFAGRAPVPDGSFGGVSHRLQDGVVLLDDALAWSVGTVRSRQIEGDHVLLIVDLSWFGVAPDSDDPMVVYESRYRSLEMS